MTSPQSTVPTAGSVGGPTSCQVTDASAHVLRPSPSVAAPGHTARGHPHSRAIPSQTDPDYLSYSCSHLFHSCPLPDSHQQMGNNREGERGAGKMQKKSIENSPFCPTKTSAKAAPLLALEPSTLLRQATTGKHKGCVLVPTYISVVVCPGKRRGSGA